MFKWKKLFLFVDIWWDQIHYLNELFEHLESEKTRIGNKRQFFIDNRQKLCEHGGLNPMIARNGNYILRKVYNSMIETFKTIGNLRVCWDLIQVKKFQISLIMTYQRAIWDVIFFVSSYLRCEICIKWLWHDM